MYITVLVLVKQKCFIHLKIIINNDENSNQKGARFLTMILRRTRIKERSGRWMI